MKNKPLFAIFLIIFINMLGFGLILPLLPYYAEGFGASDTVIGFLVAIYAAGQFLGAPILGRLSDQYGRRPILLLSIFGTLVGFLILGFANTLWLLFLSRLIDGLTGGNISVARAYISDVTTDEDRAKGLGVIGAGFGLGFIIGPATGGILSQWGFALPAFVAAGLTLLNLILVFLWLEESLPIEERKKTASKKSLFSFNALGDALKRPYVGTLLITRFFFGIAFSIFESIFSLYALRKFNLSAEQTGLVLTYVGVLTVIVQGGLMGRITKRFSEKSLISSSIAIMAIALIGWGLAPSIPVLLVVLAPIAYAGGVLTTVIPSTLSKSVEEEDIGEILGVSASTESLTRVIAPSLGGLLLGKLSVAAPGVFSGILLIGVLAYVWVRFQKLSTRSYPTSID